MVLGIDASRYGSPEATGVEWYSFYLLNELIPLLGREHNCEVRLYMQKDVELQTDVPFNVRKRVVRARRLWTTVRLSWELLVYRVDRLFVPSHTLPLIFPKKSIITIHDVAFEYFPEAYSWFQRWLLRRSTKKAVRKAWKIVVPSQATKADLVQRFGCLENKITVIPHGGPQVDRLVRWTDAEKEKYLQQFSLASNDLYVLFIGRLETKKNLVRLIEGFARFQQDFSGWKLVLAGKKGVGYAQIEQTLEQSKIKDQVIMPGYVTEEEKRFLLHGCRMVAFPSLYEGFGLPVLEGFAARRPVLTSKASALPEVAGEGARLVNPESSGEIGVGLKRLAADAVYVNKLVNKGEEELKKFSWEKAARATFAVLFDAS